MESKAMIGAALMVVGTLLFLPGLLIGVETLVMVGLVVATALLTAGTYLVGTSEKGRAV
ncbi:hypothetical protein [Candidatus Halobonum tyrrellensis]|uniref:Uncharacterized protein n=1 Tax=Candidatus Halobonum tyrrellensis G22 TaxID=1324957 RepID=V4HEF0_9EURY|nr:hypothetical protein [Candidatus Halobonum tyrrellensis]ESP88453.1 hypothetical protein K933_08337 [Candidatus Halobonum tyrrellensis G22]